jgi:DNA-binding PadR family transcriptional regulator
MVRRTAGQLLPLEVDLLSAGVALADRGEPEFHGYALAAALAEATDARRLTAHGTLYKALGRLAKAGLLDARWEDPAVAEAQGRPRRRLYRVTGSGAVALAESRASDRFAAPTSRDRRGARRPAPGASPA